MTGTPNAKRIINEGARKAIEQTKCDLANLQDCTRGLDGDLIEAIALDSPHRDRVAKAGMEVDHALMAVLSGFKSTIADYHGKYEALRKGLELG